MRRNTQVEEHRNSARFKLQGMAIAVARPPSLPPGTIKEISRSGLVFQYRENGKSGIDVQELDIIWADFLATYHLERLPVRIVSDVPIKEEGNGNESANRQQAVAFKNLTPQQENQLIRLIKARGSTPL